MNRYYEGSVRSELERRLVLYAVRLSRVGASVTSIRLAIGSENDPWEEHRLPEIDVDEIAFLVATWPPDKRLRAKEVIMALRRVRASR
ncbi:MAG: hypothetical protein ACRD1X_05570 [Vicinamibacteria bacterium]